MFYSLSLKLMFNLIFCQKGRKVMDGCVMTSVRHKREGRKTVLNLNSTGA